MTKQNMKIGSYTLAMKGCDILRQNNIECSMSKVSDSNGKYGCIYAIWVDDSVLWRSEALLRSSGIMILP